MKNYPFNKTECLTDFKQLFASCKTKYVDRDMFRVKENGGVRGIRYEEFMQGLQNLGNAFAHLGLLDGKIAVIGETSVPWLTAYFATACGGGVVVPVDKELPDDEIANILNDSGARCIVYSSTFEEVMRAIEPTVPGVEYFVGMQAQEESGKFYSYEKMMQRGAAQADRYSAISVDGNKMSAILYTSGTTGKSKGVMLTQANFVTNAEGVQAVLDMGKVCMSCLPIHHSFEFTAGIVLMLLNGTTICINDSLRYFADNLKLFQPEVIFLVPLFVDMMYRKISAAYAAQGADLHMLIEQSNALLEQGIDKRGEMFAPVRQAFGGKIKLIVSGGALLSSEMMKLFRDMGILLLNGYGITECSPVVAVNRNRFYKDGSIGPVIPCCEVKLEQVTEEGDGELWVKGSNVMLGYYKNEEATAKVLQDGWFNTEDIARIDEDGFLFITGRKKNLIVLNNGKNVYPEEIEDYLMRIPYIKEVVVYSSSVEGLGEVQLCAEIFVYEEYTREHAPEEIHSNLEKDISAVNRTLPTYKHVQSFQVRDREFEKTTKKSIKRFKV